MATDLFTLLQGGAQKGVRQASRAALNQRMGQVQGAISSSVSGGGVNPLAAARQINEGNTGERAAQASALQASLARARSDDMAGVTGLVGQGLNIGAQLGATMLGGPQAGQAAGGITKGITDGVGGALTQAVAPPPPTPPSQPQAGPANPFGTPQAFTGFPGQIAPGMVAPGIQGPSNAQQGAQPSPQPPPGSGGFPGMQAPQVPQGFSAGQIRGDAPMGQPAPMAQPARAPAPQPQAPAPQPQNALANAMGTLAPTSREANLDITAVPQDAVVTPVQPPQSAGPATAHTGPTLAGPQAPPAAQAEFNSRMANRDISATQSALSSALAPRVPLADLPPIRATHPSLQQRVPGPRLGGPSPQEQAQAQAQAAFNQRSARPQWSQEQGPVDPRRAQFDQRMMGFYSGR